MNRLAAVEKINPLFDPSRPIPDDVLAQLRCGIGEFRILWSLYVGTDKEMRNRFQQTNHPIWRLSMDHDIYQEEGLIILMAFWYLDSQVRNRAEAYLIHHIHPKFNIQYPKYQGTWDVERPWDEPIELRDLTGSLWPGRSGNCPIANKPGVYAFYVAEPL